MKRLFLLLALTILCNYHSNAQDSSALSIITTNEELDLSDVKLATIPTHGPYLLAGNKLVALTEGNDMAEIVLPDSILVDDIIWTDSTFIIRSGYAIYSLDKLTKPLMEFDITDYDIFPEDKTHIYIVSHQGDSSILFLGNLKVKRAKRLLTIGENIVYVAQTGDTTMVVTTENIYSFHGEECTRCLKLWSPLLTAVMTDRGLMFATDNEICLLTDVDEFLLLFEAQTKRLLYDSRYLYIQLLNGDLLQFRM